MILDEMLRVDRCRVGTWTNLLSFEMSKFMRHFLVRMPEPDCFLQRNAELYYVGKIPPIGTTLEQLCRRYMRSTECPSSGCSGPVGRVSDS